MQTNSNTKLVVQFFLIAAVLLAIGFFAGYKWPRPTYQSGYEQAMDDIATGEVTVTSATTRARLDETLKHAREAEYERVVSAVAEAYGIDPSEVEQDAKLVPSATGLSTNAILRKLAECTLADAHADKCFIPCSTDLDCVQKNGSEDH